MCNLYSNRLSPAMLAAALEGAGLRLSFPEGVPNAEPRDEIRITERAPVVRAAPPGAALVTLPWSWRGATGKPVFNFRAEGRRFPVESRCLIPADAFYEFTAPAAGATRKTRWRFAAADGDWIGIAGVVREGAFAMLTVEPGPDVAPIHSRQVAIVARGLWAGWLDGSAAPAEVLGPSPAGALRVARG